MMFASIPNLLVQVLLALTLSVPGMSGLMENGALEALQSEYSKALNERARLIDEIARLEGQHQSLVTRITRLKEAGSGLTTRLALEDLLRESKELSNALDALQARLRRYDARLSEQRGQLVGGIDHEIRMLEKSLAGATAKERRETVARLNALRGVRHEYTSPLPAGPASSDVNATLSLAREAEAPDELLAVADELEDTEDQLQKRLDAIKTRLDELKEARRLMRRATSFSREERFFEEVDRDRVIARFERTSSTRSDDGQNTATANSAEETSANNSNGAMNSANTVASGGVDDGQAAMNNAVDPGIESDNDFAAAPTEAARDTEPNVTDSAATPPTYDEAANDTSNQDVFSEVRETVIINSGGDPTRAVGEENGRRDGSLDSRIRALEDEEKALENQVKRLKSRARELRRKAETL